VAFRAVSRAAFVCNGPNVSRLSPLVLGALVLVLAFVAAGCRGSASACAAIEAGGEDEPRLLIGSDLPLTGPGRTKGEQIVTAIRYELQRRDWKAGAHALGYRSCDDASPTTGEVEPGICSEIANVFAGDEKVLGVIGPLDSSCAQIGIPILNQPPEGPIAVISPANTYSCLTRGGPGCDKSEPDKYYPSGVRNYVRLAPHDLYQAAAAAELAAAMGVEKVFVLEDDEAYGVGLASGFRGAADAVDVDVAGVRTWDPRLTSYTSLFKEIRRTGADAVFLAGLLSQNGGRVIADKVAVLGPNDGKVKLLAADGFATEQTISEAGPAAEGMFVIAPGLPVSDLGARGKAFASELAAGPLAGQEIDPYAIYGAEAARILLDAIAASDGTRAGVLRHLFRTSVTDGLIGSFTFDRNGDPADARGAVVGFTVYRTGVGLDPVRTIVSRRETVAAAATAPSAR
jgi:branched-chain amino acid transport system substrate-binding protein